MALDASIRKFTWDAKLGGQKCRNLIGMLSLVVESVLFYVLRGRRVGEVVLGAAPPARPVIYFYVFLLILLCLSAL